MNNPLGASHNPYGQHTQNYFLFNHFLNVGSITQVEAEAVYKIRRLASRIYELRSDRPWGNGYKLSSEMKYDAMGQRYTRYYLQKKNS